MQRARNKIKKGLRSMEDNVIANFEEVKKAFTELIEEVMRENDGKEEKEDMIFSQEAKEIVKRIADYSRKTKIYSALKAQREEFWNETKDATPALIYSYMLDRVANAPTMFHANSSVVLLMPKLDEMLNETAEGNNNEEN